MITTYDRTSALVIDMVETWDQKQMHSWHIFMTILKFQPSFTPHWCVQSMMGTWWSTASNESMDVHGYTFDLDIDSVVWLKAERSENKNTFEISFFESSNLSDIHVYKKW